MERNDTHFLENLLLTDRLENNLLIDKLENLPETDR